MTSIRKRLDELGSLQQAVMEVIWDRGEATVQEVREALADRRPAYTTVLSVLQKLERSRWVSHREKGRAYVYTAARSRQQEGSSALWTFIDGVFGDPMLALQHLIDADRLSDEELSELRRLIDARRKERSDGPNR